MPTPTTFFNTGDLDGFDALTAVLQDPRPHPPRLRYATSGPPS